MKCLIHKEIEFFDDLKSLFEKAEQEKNLNLIKKIVIFIKALS